MAKTPETFETAFDTYDLIGTIGEGGAGRVFHVKNSVGNELALKCLRPELTSSDKRKRFKNEIDFCFRNRHQNLITVLDWGVVDWNGEKTPFYVMPKYAGTLRGLMEKGISSDNVLRIFGQIIDGVEAAHKLGVTHRDLKPENILYAPEQNLFIVADLGIAHFEEEILATAVETKKGDKLLNIGYSAPEQRTKGASVDKRADIYALAQMLNEMFTGSIPEGAGHASIAEVAPNFSYLDGLVEQMRQQNPSARPQNIEELKKQLIGRKNEFIAFQELDAKKREVVRSAAPEAVLPVMITGAIWEREQLTLTLSRNPEPSWIQHFWNPRFNLSYLTNIPPNAYQFRGNTVLIRVEEQHAQAAIDQFKNWSPATTNVLQEELTREAQEADRERRRQLEQQIAAADAKVRVTTQLKI